MRRYSLDPSTPVLLRPEGAVQVGWDPRRAVMVCPPLGLSAPTLAALLRGLQAGATMAEIEGHTEGVEATVLADLVESLVDAGVVTSVASRPSRTPAIRIHGRGPLSDVLAGALRCSGARITHSRRRDAGTRAESPDLVVLTDFLAADPRVLRQLHDTGVAHLAVRVRDGAGLVGPLVIPGVTSCLDCADLHRSDRDSAWPAVAAQLRNTVGHADRATVLATAALALNQVDRVMRAVRGGDDVVDATDPPPTLDTTLEFDVSAGAVVARRWSRHPRCSC